MRVTIIYNPNSGFPMTDAYAYDWCATVLPALLNDNEREFMDIHIGTINIVDELRVAVATGRVAGTNIRIMYDGDLYSINDEGNIPNAPNDMTNRAAVLERRIISAQLSRRLSTSRTMR